MLRQSACVDIATIIYDCCSCLVQVVVKVKAISVNPVDWKVRKLEPVLNMICGEGYPLILGRDIAGEVKIGIKVDYIVCTQMMHIGRMDLIRLRCDCVRGVF